MKTWEFSLFCVVCLYCQGVAGFRLGKCRRPNLPANAVLSATSQLQLYRGQGFALHSRIKFECKVGYTANGRMWSLCDDSGQWVPEPRDAGRCLYDKRRSQTCGKGSFRCQANGECIDSRLRCDCTLNCIDGSDEENCPNARKIIVGMPDGPKSSGAVTSPGYPYSYPRKFKCTYSLITEQTSRFRLVFEEVDLRTDNEGGCEDFIKMSGVYRQSSSKVDEDISNGKSDLSFNTMICGRSNPMAVISNSSAMDVFVSLDGGGTSRGFAISWTLTPAEDLLDSNARKLMQNSHSEGRTNFIEENYITVVLPIVVSALVPILLILYMCRRRKWNPNEQQGSVFASQATSDCQQPKDSILLSDENKAMAIFYDLNGYKQGNKVCQSTASTYEQPSPHSRSFSGSDIYDNSSTPPICQRIPSNDDAHCSRLVPYGKESWVHDKRTRIGKQHKKEHCRYENSKFSPLLQKSRNKQRTIQELDVRYSETNSTKFDVPHARPSERRKEAVGSELPICKCCQPYTPTVRPVNGCRRAEIDVVNEQLFSKMVEGEFHPCRQDCGLDHKQQIPFHGSLPFDHSADRRLLVAEQPTSSHQPNSETETETTKSSLV